MKGLYVLTIPAVFVLDKILKDKAEKKLSGGRRITAPGKAARLSLSLNRGATLNIGDKHPRRVRRYSLIMSLGLSIIYLWFLITGRGGLYRTALTAALGGAYSNTFDRYRRGYVVDYISFPRLGRRLGGIVFNISDFFIIAGEIIAVAALISGETV